MLLHYDYIIIGTGAGGGSIAQVLAETEKPILILERGGFSSAGKRKVGFRSFFLKRTIPYQGSLKRQRRQRSWVGGDTKDTEWIYMLYSTIGMLVAAELYLTVKHQKAFVDFDLD